MKIIDSMTEFSLTLTSAYIEKMKQEDPAKFDQLLSVFNNTVDIAIRLLQESPEFRTQFARIHAEFTKYPECEQVIDATMEALHQRRPELFSTTK